MFPSKYTGAFSCHLVLVCLFFSLSLSAQTLVGTIKSNTGSAVEFATVSLKKTSDSSLVTAVLADDKGQYEIPKIKPGYYFLSVAFVGMRKYTSNAIGITEKSGTLRFDVMMEEDTKQLTEVQVVGKKPMFEQEAGKTTVNVENSAVSSGLMAIELLKRTPGVMVDNDGNISLKGKQNVLLLIDGKPTYLSAKQAAAILKSLSSNQISTIEVMTTPPAKYDAQGNAGVININLKKGAVQGQNGSIHTSIGQGHLPKSNIGFSLSSGSPKWTLSAVYDLTANKDFNEYWQNRNFGAITSGNKYNQRQYYDVSMVSHTFRVGADYQANKKLGIGTFVRGMTANNLYQGTNTGKVYDDVGKVSQRITSDDYNPDRFFNISTGLSGKYKIDTLGQEISADVDYAYFNQNSSQNVFNSIFKDTNMVPSTTYRLNSILPTKVNIWTFKVDYVKPVNKSMKLEMGAKQVLVNINSDVVYNFSQTGDSIFNFPNGNRFLYDERISAAYASTNIEKEKWGAVVGLRGEWWHADGLIVNKNEPFYRDSILPFPNVVLKYKPKENHEVSIAYNRRVDRPNYQNLNPISFYSDPYTVYSGNPRLRAQLTNNFELVHSFMKGMLVTTLNYSHTDNLMSHYNLVPNTDTSSKIQQMTSINIPSFTNYGVSFSFNMPVREYWNAQVFLNIYKNDYSGNLFAQTLSASRWAWQLQSTQAFSLPNNWSIEASGTYISAGLEGYTLSKEMGMLSVGIQKHVFKLQGTVKLAFQDVFYTFIYRGDVNYAGIASSYLYQWDNRLATLSFVWKFGKNRFANSGDDKEKGNVKSGRM